ncbi:histidine kinase [Sphingomonas antarctica]|uniref:CHASE3 domain-containing protein n=1 Tax=Sphingomonas antarctica TaxID=2040274 RepID=UPI0039ED6E74
MLRKSGLRAIPPVLAAALGILVAIALAGFALSISLNRSAQRQEQLNYYGRAIADVITYLRAAESGQRGYLLTHNDIYLDPYSQNAKKVVPALQQVRDNEGRVDRDAYRRFTPIVEAKLDEMAQTIALERSGDHAGAMERVQRGDGQSGMAMAETLLFTERAFVREQLATSARTSIRRAQLIAVALLLGALAVIAFSLIWLRQARATVAEADEARREAEGVAAALRVQTDARVEAEDKLRQMQKMESIGQLTGGIAHDFNNMLAVVIGSLDLAKRRIATDPVRAEAGIDSAVEGAKRAASLTARLLAFSRRQPLAPTSTDLNRLVGGMSELFSRTLGDNISVETVLSAGLWRCYADAGEIENAILNLAVNARDAMPNGGRLTIETANAHMDDDYARRNGDVEPGQYVTICVTDTGDGMSEEVMAKAFEPFFTTKDVGKGTGLGLSQVFGFAKQSGGHAAIYSEVGEGTTVKLYMPRFAGTDHGDEPAVADNDDLPSAVDGEVILVVEDEQRVRHFAVDALRELGYITLSAHSPDKALEVLVASPDVTMLFTDIIMPGMNGRQLADRALEQRPDLKVLFTTGYTRNAVVHNGMLDIGVAFLPKPYTVRQLAWKVREVLEGRGVNRPG